MNYNKNYVENFLKKYLQLWGIEHVNVGISVY